MSRDDEEEVKRASKHEIGQDLSQLSIDELHKRIDVLKQEIARLETEISGKDASKNAAEAFFKS